MNNDKSTPLLENKFIKEFKISIFGKEKLLNNITTLIPEFNNSFEKITITYFKVFLFIFHFCIKKINRKVSL